MSSSLVTILVLSYERPQYLKRILHYLSQSDISIVVADSSKEPYSGHIFGAKYLHFPEIVPKEKMFEALSQINTPYTAVCADDDFIIPDSILLAVEFLEKHPDYSSAQGAFIEFTLSKNGPPSFHPINLQGYNLEIGENDAGHRLLSLFKNYMHVFYSVSKTNLLKKVFKDAMDCDIINYNLIEIMETFYFMINGKHKAIPVFWGARESAYREVVSYGTITDRLELIAISDKYKEEYERFIKCTTKFYVEKTGVSNDKAEVVIRKTVQIYLDSINKNTIGEINYDRINSFLRMKGDLIKKISNKIYHSQKYNFLSKIWFNNIFGKHYSKERYQPFVNSKYFEGVPFYTRKGLRQIEKISEYVEKYPVQ